MLNPIEIKAKAVKLFEEAKYPEAFTELWTLKLDEFIPYILNVQRKSNRPPWLHHEIGGQYFWDIFILQPNVFKNIFQSNHAEDFLTTYFEKYNRPGKKLIEVLAETFPETLIRSIRTNRVFLKPEWIKSLSIVELNPAFKAHAYTWKKIRAVENFLWQKVEDQITQLDQYTIDDLLAETLIWLEQERFKKNNNHTINILGRIYSFFVEKIIPRTTAPLKRSVLLNSEDPFFKVFLSCFERAYATKNTGTFVTRILDSIKEWLSFNENICDSYAFDLAVNPSIENESLFLQTSPEYHYSCLLDGIRYQVVQFFYYTKGTDLVKYSEETGEIKIPKGRRPGDEDVNRNIANLKYSTLSMLLDLCIHDFNVKNRVVNAEEVIRPLITFSLNRQIRYENSFKKFIDSSSNWFEAYMQLTMESVREDIRKEPYLFMSQDKFQKLNFDAADTPVETTQALVQLFGYELSSASNIDRFNCRYDVWDSPLLIIGNDLFCPILFWGSNVWFYAFIQRALLMRGKSATYSGETTEMEKYLGTFFESKQWKVKVIAPQEASQIDGDVDLIIEGENDTLLIQLKRTYLRLNIKDSYNESKMIDRKAADQLLKVEHYLKTENPVYTLNKKATKWIVTTSLEGINSNINGSRKINYFELLLALQVETIRTVRQLINYVETDKYLLSLQEMLDSSETSAEEKKTINSFGLPIPLFEPKMYKPHLNSDHPDATIAYNKTFNEALDYDARNDKNKAIELLHKCTLLNTHDAEAWSALANVLCDIKQFEQAFICFEKALILLPFDPFITRNYSFALFEAGQHARGLNMLIDISKKYPFLGQISKETIHAFYGFISQGILSEKEALSIAKKLGILPK